MGAMGVDMRNLIYKNKILKRKKTKGSYMHLILKSDLAMDRNLKLIKHQQVFL